MTIDLRPQSLSNFVGQHKAVSVLSNVIGAALARGEYPRHVLFTGGPGLGKTSLAMLIARECGGTLKSYHGATVRSVSDMAAIVLDIHSGDVVFVDEIHSLPPKCAEMLYVVMEDASLDFVMGDASTRIPLRWKLPKAQFTVVGATTRLSKVPQPMRDRFGVSNTLELAFYEVDDLTTILETDVAKLCLQMPQKVALQEVARRGRGTPRIAIDLLLAVRDYARAHGVDFTPETVQYAMESLDVDPLGLTAVDRRYMGVLVNQFRFEPAGVNAIASVMNIEEATLHSVVEPWLLRLGFVRRTPRGRKLTLTGAAHIKVPTPEGYEG